MKHHRIVFILLSLAGCAQPPALPSPDGKARVPVNKHIPTHAPLTLPAQSRSDHRQE